MSRRTCRVADCDYPVTFAVEHDEVVEYNICARHRREAERHTNDNATVTTDDLELDERWADWDWNTPEVTRRRAVIVAAAAAHDA